MCAVCFTAAQVVPLGALYARAKFVSMREAKSEGVPTQPEPDQERRPTDAVPAGAR